MDHVDVQRGVAFTIFVFVSLLCLDILVCDTVVLLFPARAIAPKKSKTVQNDSNSKVSIGK